MAVKGKRRIKVTDNGKCSVTMYCHDCWTEYELRGFSNEQLDRLYERHCTNEPIQDILPEVDPKWREMFKSATCPDCWDRKLGIKP